MHAIWSYPILSSAVAAEGGDWGLPGGGSPGAIFTHRGLLRCGWKSYLLCHSIIMSRRGYDGRPAFYRIYSRWEEDIMSLSNSDVIVLLHMQLPNLFLIDFMRSSLVSSIHYPHQIEASNIQSRRVATALQLSTPQSCNSSFRQAYWVGDTPSLLWVYTPFSPPLLCTSRLESLKGEVRRRTWLRC